MKRREKRTIPAQEKLVVVETICDLCRKPYEEADFYNFDEVEIARRAGTHYPDGGNATDTTFDICGPCFESKLVPWMESQGATPETTESDW